MRPLLAIFLLSATCLSVSGQRFIKVFDTINTLVAANPNDVHTNVFVAGLTNVSIYTWSSASTDATNANLSVLKANNFSTGRWFLHPSGGGAGITNFFETIYVTNLTVLNTNTFITNFFFNSTYITNINQGVGDSLWTNSVTDTGAIQPSPDANVFVPGEIHVGQTGEAGVITLSSTNGTHAVHQTVDPDGVLTFTADPAIPNDYLVKFISGPDTVAELGAWGELALYGDNASIYMFDVSLNQMTVLSPTRADGITPYVLGLIAPHTTGNMFEVDNDGTLEMVVAVNSGYAGGGTKFLSDNGTYIVNPFYFNSGLGYIENVNHSQDQFRIVNSANSGLFVFATAGSQAVTLGTNVTIAPYNPDSTANPAFVFNATVNWTTTNLVFRVGDNGGTPLFGIAGESGWTGAGTKALFDDGTYKSVGVVGSYTRQLPLLRFPDSVDGAGCTYVNTNDVTARTFMRPRFSAAGVTNANFATFSCLVPSDLSTSVNLTATLKVALVAGDTAASTYTVGMASVANSASSSPTAANYVTLTVPADGSGAAGDVEGVSNVTLTGWAAAMTAGQWLFIQLQRDGTDASATAEDLLVLEITYTSTQ